MLEHHAGGVLLDDPHDHLRRHDHIGRERVILDHEGHVRADGFHRIGVIRDDLVVGLQGGGRRDHDAGGARIHHLGGQARHGGKARGRHADDHGNASRHRGDHLAGESQRLIRRQLGRFAHNAENRQPGGTGFQIGFDHSVGRGNIHAPVALEGRGADDIDAGGRTREQGFLRDKAGREVRAPPYTRFPPGALP
jgi:hypothetical protein